MRTMNPNSLKNLSAPRRKKEGRGHRNKIPVEKVNELFAYLSDDMSLKRAAEKCDITFSTAKRYYDRGDVSRGITPLKQRLSVFQENIQKKMSITLQEHRTKRLELVQKLLVEAENNIFKFQKFYDKEGNEIDVYDQEGNKIEKFDLSKISIRDIERLMKLESFLSGSITVEQKQENTFLSADDIVGMNND